MIPSRRQFVVSTLSAVPFLLHEAPVAVAQTSTHPVLDEIFRQMADAQNLSDRSLAESARRQAAAMRMLAAFGESAGWDTRFRAGLRAEIRRRGRDVLVTERPDFAALRLELRQRGIGNLTADDLPYDPVRKSKALDRLLGRGVTASLREGAALLESLVPELERLRPARQTKQEQKCQELAGYTLEFEFMMTFACAFLYWGVWPPCAIQTLVYFTWKSYIADTYNCY